MNDDELRDRLHAMPEPSTTIDVDAVVADARRRRRPKVVGVAVASVAGCLALLAPVVVPGLLGPDPVTATLQDSGAAEQAPAGSAPEPTDESAGGDPSVAGGGESSSAADACIAPPEVASIVDGLGIAFGDDPSDGTATVLLSNAGADPVVVDVGEVGTLVRSGGLVATSTSLATDAPTTPVAIAAGETASLDVDVVRTSVACGYGPGGMPTSPLVVLVVDGAPTIVVGEAYEP